MSTRNLCFWRKNKKKVYPCKSQFYYNKVGCKGLFVTRTCLHDVFNTSKGSLGMLIFHISSVETKPGCGTFLTFPEGP